MENGGGAAAAAAAGGGVCIEWRGGVCIEWRGLTITVRTPRGLQVTEWPALGQALSFTLVRMVLVDVAASCLSVIVVPKSITCDAFALEDVDAQQPSRTPHSQTVLEDVGGRPPSISKYIR